MPIHVIYSKPDVVQKDGSDVNWVSSMNELNSNSEAAYYDSTSSTMYVNFDWDSSFTQIQLFDTTVTDTMIGISEDLINVRKDFALHSPFPNPYSDQTTIQWDVLQVSDYQLEIRNLLGQLVYEKSYSNLPIGRHKLNLGELDGNSNIYLVRLTNGTRSELKRLVKYLSLIHI